MSAIFNYTALHDGGTGAPPVQEIRPKAFLSKMGVKSSMRHAQKHLEGILWLVAFLSLIIAAMTTGTAYLLALAFIGILSFGIVIPLHFYGAWRRWQDVPNKRQYGVWVGMETVATIALIGLFIYAVFSR